MPSALGWLSRCERANASGILQDHRRIRARVRKVKRDHVDLLWLMGQIVIDDFEGTDAVERELQADFAVGNALDSENELPEGAGLQQSALSSV